MAKRKRFRDGHVNDGASSASEVRSRRAGGSKKKISGSVLHSGTGCLSPPEHCAVEGISFGEPWTTMSEEDILNSAKFGWTFEGTEKDIQEGRMVYANWTDGVMAGTTLALIKGCDANRISIQWHGYDEIEEISLEDRAQFLEDVQQVSVKSRIIYAKERKDPEMKNMIISTPEHTNPRVIEREEKLILEEWDAKLKELMNYGAKFKEKIIEELQLLIGLRFETKKFSNGNCKLLKRLRCLAGLELPRLSTIAEEAIKSLTGDGAGHKPAPNVKQKNALLKVSGSLIPSSDGQDRTKVNQMKLTRVLSEKHVRNTMAGLAPNAQVFNRILEEDCDCYDENTGELLFMFRKNVISATGIQSGKSTFSNIDTRMKESQSRGNAAGNIVMKDKFKNKDSIEEIVQLGNGKGRIVLKSGKALEKVVSNPVKSFKAGVYYDMYRKKNAKWGFSNSFPRDFQNALPLFYEVGELFELFLPKIYNLHKERDTLHLASCLCSNTPLSTVSINVNYETYYHKDRGDFSEGFSTLTVLQVGNYSGGYIVFPEYSVGFDVREGDILFSQSHKLWHGNTKIIEQGSGKRISVVTYLRQKLHNGL